MPVTERQQLRFVDADELRGWSASLEGVGIMSVNDEMIGGLDGLLVDENGRALYLVVVTRAQPPARYLLPIGTAWFDDTASVIRTDATAKTLGQCPSFDPHAYRQMSPEESWRYERQVLAACCPETLNQSADRVESYTRLPQFRPAAWLKPTGNLEPGEPTSNDPMNARPRR